MFDINEDQTVTIGGKYLKKVTGLHIATGIITNIERTMSRSDKYANVKITLELLPDNDQGSIDQSVFKQMLKREQEQKKKYPNLIDERIIDL